jgi:hypothetical protein
MSADAGKRLRYTLRPVTISARWHPRALASHSRLETFSDASTVVISRSAAAQLCPTGCGRRVRCETNRVATVIGVVEDVKQGDYREAPQSVVYFRSW